MKTDWKKRNQMDSHARSDDEEVVGGRSSKGIMDFGTLKSQRPNM